MVENASMAVGRRRRKLGLQDVAAAFGLLPVPRTAANWLSSHAGSSSTRCVIKRRPRPFTPPDGCARLRVARAAQLAHTTARTASQS